MQQPFVEREPELNQLQDYLVRIFKEQSQVCFVEGDAGSGKSSLIYNFSAHVENNYKDLVFLVGTCNAQTGLGDSYLPFRQIMAQLLGDDKSVENLVTDENTERLRKNLKTSARALIEVAPELIGTLIPGAGILMSLGKFAIEEAGWFKKLAQKSSDTRNRVDLSQSQLMFQYTALLRKIALTSPLVVVLDDLQWADDASITLLFHLIRALTDSQILFVGMYRPNDIVVNREGERHLLRSMLNELKRYRGNIVIDLNLAQQKTACAFIDTLLDTEPNRLNKTFRQKLVRLTSGHPLFTIEIIRNMQEVGNIVQDNEGFWIAHDKLEGVLKVKLKGNRQGCEQAV